MQGSCPETTSTSTVCTISCAVGYIGDNVDITCEDDGQYGDSRPDCHKSCSGYECETDAVLIPGDADTVGHDFETCVTKWK